MNTKKTKTQDRRQSLRQLAEIMYNHYIQNLTVKN